MKNSVKTILFAVLAFCAIATAFAAGAPDPGFLSLGVLPDFDQSMALAPVLIGIGNIDAIMKQVAGIEGSLEAFQKQAKLDIESTGKIGTETQNAITKMGEQQREIADRLLAIEQKGTNTDETPLITSWGKQFINSTQYENYRNGSNQKARFEVQNNTLTGADATVAPDRKMAIVPGAFAPLTLEGRLPSLPTTSNAIEFTKEASYTNNAAEAAEGAAKAESALTWSLVNMPVSTVAHWIKISRQLAADAPALAAYVNTRMAYGVNRRVETQLAVGDGTAPNISGIFDSGNYTAHGLLSGALGSTLPKLVLIRKIIGTLWSAGYPADAILLNPADWATIEIELITTAAGQARVSIDAEGNARLFGVPVIQSIGVAADTFAVGAFQQACTKYDRQGVVVELSESDSDNFTKNLITIRAERRLALAVEVPAAIIGGDLTPAAS